MEQTIFIEQCQRLFGLNGMGCTEEQAKQLFSLTCRMLEVNRVMNLTAITEPQALILRHYVDSLTVAEHLPTGATLLDVGCGAGFPTLPLAIFRPDLRITALDGTAKRIRYVEETCRLLGLGNVEAVAGRAEELAHQGGRREQYAVVVARAVANLSVLGELCLGFVAVGGKLIAMKAQQAEEELAQARSCLSQCGGGSPTVLTRPLRSAEGETESRALIFVPKIKETPKNFPRHFSKISKKPL